MTTMEFLNLLFSLLRSVLAGSSSYTELQKFVDNAVIEDELPDDLPKEILQDIFDLQTDLELIAENQSTYAGTSSMLRKEDIIEKLQKYEEKLAVN